MAAATAVRDHIVVINRYHIARPDEKSGLDFQRLFRIARHVILRTMKKEIIIGIILIFIFSLIIGYYVSSYNTNKSSVQPSDQNANTNQAGLTTSVVAEHSAQNDCWIIVQGKVYNVTNYLVSHPGGAGEITPYCGRDATQAFQTKAGRGTHSQTAYDEIAKYLVGTLGGRALNINGSNSNLNINETANSNANGGTNSAAGVVLTSAEVARHASSGDCWFVYNASVYNVSTYLILHPGGAGEITPYCGKDATIAMNTKAGQGAHSSQAFAYLSGYKIGTLNSTVSSVNVANPDTAPPAPTNPIVTTPRPDQMQNLTTLTAAEVAKHATASDCWFIYNSSVFNLTSYLRSHPGGAGEITPYCGKDATIAMDTKAGKGTHSSQAFASLAGYIIGTLNSTVDNGQITNTNQPLPNTNTNSDDEDDGEDEDEDEDDGEDEDEDEDDDG